MKHNWKAVSILVLLFLAAQVIGLAVTQSYIHKPELPLNIERPQVTEEQKSYTFVPILVFVLIATGLTLLLWKFNLFKFWKIWFLLSVWLCLTVSFNAFVAEKIAIALAAIFALWKVYRNNVFVHNFTEMFVYSALVAIFGPLLNITSVMLLLMGISVYDYIAVRRTKHMITLAKFQSKAKLFAGLLLPYKKKAEAVSKKAASLKVPEPSSGSGVAILGGGDIGFPLLFAGVVMREMGLGFLNLKTFIIPVFAAIALLLLFLFGSDKKFYPAMPYITAGCLSGYLLVYLL